MSKKNLLWVEKYRPSTIDECILPEAVKKQAKGMIEAGNMNHLILHGGAGTGKTTLAKAMCNELGADFIMYNGSDGSLNLEELRENIANFAHTTSIKGNNAKHKVIIIDEADYLDWRMQPALRNAMEKYASGCRFILTCNYPDKIIEPLHSRCAAIDYKFDKVEMNVLVKQFARRTIEILQAEKITYDIDALKGVIVKFFPDNRKILNELQKYANLHGTIDDGILDALKSNTDDLFKAINDKDFAGVKQWLVNNNTSSIFNMLYREGEKYIPKELLPLWILKIGEGQKWHGTVPDQELNVLTAITDYMADS